MMYGSSDIECNGQNFLSFWTIFCPFTPYPQNQNSEKMKILPGDIIILYRCNINDNPMMYGSCPNIPSAMDRIFCHFGSFFALLPH